MPTSKIVIACFMISVAPPVVCPSWIPFLYNFDRCSFYFSFSAAVIFKASFMTRFSRFDLPFSVVLRPLFISFRAFTSMGTYLGTYVSSRGVGSDSGAFSEEVSESGFLKYSCNFSSSSIFLAALISWRLLSLVLGVSTYAANLIFSINAAFLSAFLC